MPNDEDLDDRNPFIGREWPVLPEVPYEALVGEDTAYIFIDTENAMSGYKPMWLPIGADYLIMVSGMDGVVSSRALYKYVGGGGSWSWEKIKNVSAALDSCRLETQIRFDDIGLLENEGFDVYFCMATVNNLTRDSSDDVLTKEVGQNIIIINPQSYTPVGEDWNIYFGTTGSGILYIDDMSFPEDASFKGLYWLDQVVYREVPATVYGNVISASWNYTYGRAVFVPRAIGNQTLKFIFGNTVYAENTALSTGTRSEGIEENNDNSKSVSGSKSKTVGAQEESSTNSSNTLFVSVNTKKSIYHPNESAEVIIVVLDQNGYLIPNANISLLITDPTGKITEYSTSSEAANAIIKTSKGVYGTIYQVELEGNYTLFVTALGNEQEGYVNSYFWAKEYYEFDIIRDVPVVIDPNKGPFNSTITVISYTDASTFTLREYLPSDFNVTDAGGAVVFTENDRKVLEWTNLVNNSTVTYSAQVSAKHPYIRNLGPAEIDYEAKTFTEARAWMLAVDPLYNFSSGAGTDKWAYGGLGGNDGPPADNTTPSTEFTADEYTNISESNDVRVTTSGGTATANPTHRFKFTLNEAASEIENLTVSWEGYSTSAGCKLYIWNYTGAKWDLLGSHSETTKDGTITVSITDSTKIGYYVNSTKNLELCAVAVANKAPEIMTDYVYVETTVPEFSHFVIVIFVLPMIVLLMMWVRKRKAIATRKQGKLLEADKLQRK